MTVDERPLNEAEHYYLWGEVDGRLTIYSECCRDSFSEAEERVLRDHLMRKHPIEGTTDD